MDVSTFTRGGDRQIMPTTTNKQRLFTHILGQLPKAGKGGPDGGARLPESLPVLEQFLYAICRQGTTREEADRAFNHLRERFFDWNEVRVSSQRELGEVFDDVPDGDLRGQRLVSFLQEVFETTYSFDLEGLQKKGLKQAAKQLQRYQAANDYTVAWVILHSLGGHAVPVDAPTLRVLRRLGLVDEDNVDPEALRASLEHHIPKSKGGLFYELLSALADEVCFDEEPTCPSCPLASHCPTGQEYRATTVPSETSGRHKPR
jgi:endonuclease III